MGVDQKKLNIRTALVYSGAALLIVVVGMRTLMQTSDEGIGTIGMITIGALLLEFALLLLYAYTIATQDTEPQTSGGGTSNGVKFEPLVAKLNEVVESNSNIKESLDSFSGELSETRTVLAEHSGKLAELGEELKGVVIKDKLQGEINNILSSLLSEKKKK